MVAFACALAIDAFLEQRKSEVDRPTRQHSRNKKTAGRRKTERCTLSPELQQVLDRLPPNLLKQYGSPRKIAVKLPGARTFTRAQLQQRWEKRSDDTC